MLSFSWTLHGLCMFSQLLGFFQKYIDLLRISLHASISKKSTSLQGIYVQKGEVKDLFFSFNWRQAQSASSVSISLFLLNFLVLFLGLETVSNKSSGDTPMWLFRIHVCDCNFLNFDYRTNCFGPCTHLVSLVSKNTRKLNQTRDSFCGCKTQVDPCVFYKLLYTI